MNLRPPLDPNNKGRTSTPLDPGKGRTPGAQSRPLPLCCVAPRVPRTPQGL